MNSVKVIHQFTPRIGYGDGVSRGVFLTQKMLLDLGYESKIYVNHKDIDKRIEHQIQHIEDYVENEESFLIYHHSFENQVHDKMMELKDKKILAYHNITPSFYFDGEIYQARADEGRQQLARSVKSFFSAFADSEYNKQELEYWGFKNVEVLPLLVDLPLIHLTKRTAKADKKYFNLLFVGRVIQNKCQHQLIDLVYELKNRGYEKIHLDIVGGNHYSDYFNYLFKYINALNLHNYITIHDKVSDDDLQECYENADLYISMSEHEGFGMPLIEAISCGIPVLAYNAGGVPMTIGEYGLFNSKAIDSVADRVEDLIIFKEKREILISHQIEYLRRFDYEILKVQLQNFLQKMC